MLVKLFMLCRQACEICENLIFPLFSGSRKRIRGFRPLLLEEGTMVVRHKFHHHLY
jgi:hypothetical protein